MQNKEFLYKFIFGPEKQVVKVCEVDSIRLGVVWYKLPIDSPSGNKDYLMKTILENEIGSKTLRGGRFQTVYLWENDPEKAKQMLVEYYERQIERVSDKIRKYNQLISLCDECEFEVVVKGKGAANVE